MGPLCVVTAIDADLAILSQADAPAPARLAALKFLGHWVGDVHQPLHVSFKDDSGAMRSLNGIRIKLSVDRPHEVDGFALVSQTLPQYLRCGTSFTRRLDDQTFGGGTDRLEKAAQLELGLKNGLHPPLGERLEMPYEFQHAQLAWFLLPERRPYLRAEHIIEEHEEHATIQIT